MVRVWRGAGREGGLEMADFLLYDCGSIVQLTPQTDSAKEWLQENVENV